MDKVCLITDSACDIPVALAEEHDIWVLPVTVTYGGKERKEYYEIDIQEYWDFLEQNEELPTTAQITPAQYLEVFHRAREQGYTKIICLMINASGSGTCASGMVARDLYYAEQGRELEIRIIDSKNYTIAYGKALILAREALRAGATYEQAIDTIEEHISRVEAIAGVYTLRQLKKSGRINGAAAFMGEILGIKPVIHLCNAQVNILEKTRGEKNVIPTLFDCLEKQMDKSIGQEKACSIIHGKVPEEDLRLVSDTLRDKYGLQNVERIPIGCSVITNTGPNVIGIVYYGKKRV